MNDIKEIFEDNEKRNDYLTLSKKEFLDKYPAITETDYDELRQSIYNMDLKDYVKHFMPNPKHIPVTREDEPEFIGQFIDIFEDFLDEKGIVIPNQKRDFEEDLEPEESANIYGEDYDFLEQEIKKVLIRWEIIANKENPKPWLNEK